MDQFDRVAVIASKQRPDAGLIAHQEHMAESRLRGQNRPGDDLLGSAISAHRIDSYPGCWGSGVWS